MIFFREWREGPDIALCVMRTVRVRAVAGAGAGIGACVGAGAGAECMVMAGVARTALSTMCMEFNE